MIKLATVLIFDTDQSRAETLLRVLTQAGYHAVAVATANEASARSIADPPDLALIGGNRCSIEYAIEFKKHPLNADIPVLLLVDTLAPDICERACALGIDDVIAADFEEIELLSRMRPLIRLATMRAELDQRALIAGSFGVSARPQVDVAATRPLVLVSGENVSLLSTILDDFVELVFVDCLYAAEDQLTHRNFDAAILSFAEATETVLGFCAQVRNNPRLFNLPMVLMISGQVSVSDAYRRGATRLLHGALDPIVVRTAVLSLVRRQQLRWTIRNALADSLAPATRDLETGAYSRLFLEAYLRERLAHAIHKGRHLSVVFFSAPNIDGVARQFGRDPACHLTQQLGHWIGGLLRAEDLVARTGEHEFCVVLPDTPLVEAEVVMHRIAGVLAYTDFAVRDVYQPVKVWVQVGATDAQVGDDLPQLLARARRNLD